MDESVNVFHDAVFAKLLRVHTQKLGNRDPTELVSSRNIFQPQRASVVNWAPEKRRVLIHMCSRSLCDDSYLAQQLRHLDLGTAIRQTRPSRPLDPSRPSDISPPIRRGPHPPQLDLDAISGFNGAGKPRRHFSQARRVAPAKLPHNLVGDAVVRVDAVHDDAAVSHLGSVLGRAVQRVVVTVEACGPVSCRVARWRGSDKGVCLPVQVRGLLVNGQLEGHIRAPPLGRRELFRLGAPGPVPVALADVEQTANVAGIDVARDGVDEGVLDAEDGPRLALVVDAQDAGAELKVAALGRDGQRPENLDGAVAVDEACGV